MMKSILASLLFAAAVLIGTAPANAEMIRCVSFHNGYCDTGLAGRPFYGRRQAGYGYRTEMREEEERIIRHHSRCHVGTYVAELDTCIARGAPTADVPNDPECRGKPPGFRFDRRVTGPHGEVGVDHRVCR